MTNSFPSGNSENPRSKDHCRKVAFKTLGCKLNQAETEALATGFKSLGWTVAMFGDADDVDAIIVNSCTVTNAADRKSRAAMNRALRIVKESAAEKTLVVMTGCYADGHRDILEKDGRTFIVGNGSKSRLPQLVDAFFHGEVVLDWEKHERDPFGFPSPQSVFRTRAMVKVQDGCDRFCTYCIIPFVRGRGISRPLNETVRAVEEAVETGYREIVLTGVNMSRWREGKAGFADLVAACLDVRGNFRLRLGSVEPDKIEEDLLNLITHPRMTPHMHLCLQSGSEKVLRAMKRQYSVSEFEGIAGELRSRIPHFNITTDVIVGFPGETNDDFADTVAVCERLGFGHIHTFPYSRREGTQADKMPNQVSEEEKKRRAGIIRALSERTKRGYREMMIGSRQEVLVESGEREPDGNLTVRGLSASYVPVRFALPGTRESDDVRNRFFTVSIDEVDTGNDPDVLGSVIPHF